MFLSNEQFNEQYDKSLQETGFLSDAGFKTKYEKPVEKESWFRENVIGGYKQRWKETKAFGKGVGAAAVDLSSFIRDVTEMPERTKKRLGIIQPEKTPEKTPIEKIIPEKMRTQVEDPSVGEKVSFWLGENLVWFIPGTRQAKVARQTKLALDASKKAKAIAAGKKVGAEATEFAVKAGVAEGEADIKDIGTGAALGLTGVTVGALSKSMPSWFMKKAIKEKDLAHVKGRDVTQYALDKNKVGTLKGLVDKSKEEIEKLIIEINEKLPEKQAFSDKWFRGYMKGAEEHLKKDNIERTFGSMAKAVKHDFEQAFKGTGRLAEKIYKETVFRDTLMGAKEKGKGLLKMKLKDIGELSANDALGVLYKAGRWKHLLAGGTGWLMGGPIWGAASYATGKAMGSTAVLSGLGIGTNYLKKLSESEKSELVRIIMEAIYKAKIHEVTE